MKFKFFILFFILVLAVLAYFGYPIVKNRYFGNSTKTIQLELPENIPAVTNEAGVQKNETPEAEFESDSLSITITSADCDSQCSQFKTDQELKYCQEICGLNPSPNNTSLSNCDTMSGIDKDYCLKNLAIQKKDFKLCDQINDSGIKKTCKNRITEDIIENQ